MKATATPRRLSTSSLSSFKTIREGVLDLLPRRRIKTLAVETGFMQRLPKQIPPFEFLLCTMLTSAVEDQRGFASLGRLLLAAAGIDVARSAVHQRFSKASADFVEQAFRETLDRLPARAATPEILGLLDDFTAVLADDGSVLSLSPILGDLFPATRTNHTQAAAKVHLTADLVHRRIVRVELTGERESERAVARGHGYERGVLYIRDLGYTGYTDYRDIVAAEAFLLMRLKSSANPRIVGVRHGVRAPKSSVGQKLSEVVLKKSALTFDLDARFDLADGGTVDLRIVGRRDPETQEVHWYVTNLSPARFEVESLVTLYRLRWIIELMFKVLKSHCHLGHLDTGNPHALRTFIYASLLMALVITALVATGAAAGGMHPSEVSILTLGRALPLIAIPLLLLWLRRKLTYDELAEMILRVVAIGCKDQNPGRTRAFWGALN